MDSESDKQKKIAAALQLIEDVQSKRIIPIFERRLGPPPTRVSRNTAVGLGSCIRNAIEAATGTSIICGTCLNYILSLDAAPLADSSIIVQKLAALPLPLPMTVRAEHDTLQKRRDWLVPIIDAALLAWVDSP